MDEHGMTPAQIYTSMKRIERKFNHVIALLEMKMEDDRARKVKGPERSHARSGAGQVDARHPSVGGQGVREGEQGEVYQEPAAAGGAEGQVS
ncbi:MAG TPA: hypothetical protein VMS92_18955 [Mycobacterium sp.]|nr:hypothetical protein [Mycobacterium sp.]